MEDAENVGERSVMLFRPMQSQLVGFDASPSDPKRVTPESCIAPYYLETVDVNVVQLLGALPRQDALLPSKPTGTSLKQDSTEFFELHSHYKLQKKFAGGSFGEIWRAVLRKESIKICKAVTCGCDVCR